MDYLIIIIKWNAQKFHILIIMFSRTVQNW